MIKFVKIQPELRYGSFFLAIEAPDDESPSRPNVKRLKISRRGGSRKDFAADIDLGDTDEAEEVQEEEPVNDDAPDEDGVDFASDEEAVDNTETSDVDEPSEDAPDEEDADFTGDDGDSEEDVELDTTDEEDAEEDADFADGEDAEEDADTSDDTSTDTDDAEDKGPGLDGESTRKYNLFKEYTKLYASIGNYIDTMDNIVLDGVDKNLVMKRSIDRLKSIKKLTYDYMITKFSTVGYTESSLFFEKLIVSTQLAIKLLVLCSTPESKQKPNAKKKPIKK